MIPNPFKGGSVEETLMYKFSPYNKFEFSFSVTLYLFKNCPSQFLSYWKLAEPVFCSVLFLPYKNQKKILTLSFLLGKIKFAVC